MLVSFSLLLLPFLWMDARFQIAQFTDDKRIVWVKRTTWAAPLSTWRKEGTVAPSWTRGWGKPSEKLSLILHRA